MRLKDTITPEMKLGRPEFENTVFMLNNPVNALNLDHFAFRATSCPNRSTRLPTPCRHT